MISKENIATVLNELSKEDIEKAFDSNEDYLHLALYIFNAGYVVELNATNYDQELEEEASANGHLFCDKDNFLTLFKESDSINPYLIELI